jgi:hypothetical protein
MPGKYSETPFLKKNKTSIWGHQDIYKVTDSWPMSLLHCSIPCSFLGTNTWILNRVEKPWPVFVLIQSNSEGGGKGYSTFESKSVSLISFSNLAVKLFNVVKKQLHTKCRAFIHQHTENIKDGRVTVRVLIGKSSPHRNDAVNRHSESTVVFSTFRPI